MRRVRARTLPRTLGSRGTPAGGSPAPAGPQGGESVPAPRALRPLDGARAARFDQPPADDEVGLRAAGRDEDLLGRAAGVEGGDPGPQQVRAVRLAVAEPHLEQLVRGAAGELEQLSDR